MVAVTQTILYAVCGIVYDEYNSPLDNALIRLFDIGLRSEQKLGQTNTDAKGFYSINFKVNAAMPEYKAPDVQLRVYKTANKLWGQSPVYFNVGQDTIINHTLGGAPIIGENEFDALVKLLTPIIKPSGIELGKLVENDTHEDISFLAGETGEDEHKIHFLNAAFNLVETKIDPAIFYGLFRMGFPKELNTLLQIKSESLQAGLKQAIGDHIISSRWLPELDRIIRQLERLAVNNLLEGNLEGTELFKKVMSPLLTIDQQKIFLDSYFANESNPEKFWEQLKLQPGFEDGIAIEKSSTALRLNLLTDGQPELVNQLHKAQGIDQELKEISGFAKYSKEDWISQIKEADIQNFPGWVTGESLEQKVDEYASSLEQLHKELYPTTFFSARMHRDEQSAFLLKDELQLFFRKNPDFDLNTKNIGKQLADSTFDGIQDKETIRKELRTINRLYKLTDEYATVNALYGKQLFSATDIVTKYGKEQFTSQFATAVGSTELATQIYEKAVSVNNKATALITSYKMRHDIKLFAIDGHNPAPEGYHHMFGDSELCECQHCQSVYSPAAYYVDMLAFIKSENSAAFDELLRRRPDLDDILLTCKNTNTPLPYIDLVNELLEKEVVKLSGVNDTEGITAGVHSYQTEGIAAELMASPEHSSTNAIEQLKIVTENAVFSPLLPLDLPLEETKAYSDKLGWSRMELMEVFYGVKEPGKYKDPVLAAELFGFSQAELAIINGTASFAVTLPENSDHIKSVNAFLDRTKLGYIELLQLLETYFINPIENGSRIIHITQVDEDSEFQLLTCDLDKLMLTGATDAWMNKLVRFVRLWKKTNWDIFDLDRTLTALKVKDFPISETEFNEKLLVPLAQIERIRRVLNMPWRSVKTLFSNIDTDSYRDHSREGQPIIPSLYEVLFRNKTLFDLTQSVFPENAENLSGNINDHFKLLCAVFGIKDQELVLLSEEGETLSLESLSRIHRQILLARALKLSIQDLKSLISITGKEPANGMWSPGHLLEFLDEWYLFKSSGIMPDAFNTIITNNTGADFSLPVDHAIAAFVHQHLEALNTVNEDATITDEQLRKDKLDAQLSLFLKELGEKTVLLTAIEGNLSNPDDLALKSVIQSYLGEKNKKSLLLLTGEEKIAKLERLEALVKNYIFLKTTPQIIKHFRFSAEKAEWLHDNRNVLSIGILWDENIDTQSPELYPSFKSLLYFSMVDKIKTTSDVSWTELFDIPIVNGPNAKSVWVQKCIELYLISEGYLNFLTGPKNDVNNKGSLNLGFPNDFLNPEHLSTIFYSSGIMDKLNATYDQLQSLITVNVLGQDAVAVKNLLKSKYGDNDWVDIIKPINDSLRNRRRDALTAWLLANSFEGTWQSPNDIYESLLIDTEMDACMVTSRIKQAIGSIQLYVDRCLMHLEKPDGNTIVPGENFAKQWSSWRKQYRIWEANWKIFLFPENWIEPDLRDGKSPFFKELESQIKQSDITEDTAKDALLAYLEKLDVVANLEIIGLFNDQETKMLHVFGRTQNIPHQYFYRKQESSVWTAWEKVDVDIEGDHILPVVWNGRLLLFWGQFMEKQEEDNGSVSITGSIGEMTMDTPPPLKYLEVKLAWTEYKKGKWGAKKISKESNSLRAASPLILKEEHVSFSPIIDEGKLYLRLICPLRTDIDTNFLLSGSFPIFVFDGCNSAPTLTETDFNVNGLRSRIINKLPSVHRNKMMILEKAGVDSFGLFNTGIYKSYPTTGNLNIYSIFGNTPGEFQILPDQYEIEKDKSEIFFYKNNRNNFYVHSTDTLRPFTADFSVENAGLLMARKSISPVNTYYPSVANTRGRMLRSVSPAIRDQINPDLFNGVFEVAQPFKVLFRKKYLFQTFYHPYVCSYIKRLNTKGISDLYKEEVQSTDVTTIFSTTAYNPTSRVSTPYPVEELDFSYGGSYSLYNWELFFHIPLLMATRLSQNQKFEEARKWFHYIFDPTKSSNGNSGAERNWITRPFRNEVLNGVKSLTDLLNDEVNSGDLEKQLSNWENNPFNPHAVARLRISAYMRSTVLKYIDNLIQWGDQLFRRDTIESINEATLLYILASNLLGKKPEVVPPRANPVELSFATIEESGINQFNNAKTEIESFISPSIGEDNILMPYFCMPKNDYILKYWDTVGDRLFKIRHCMNIQGIVRQLPLFEPPIDPGLLVRAKAAGLDLSTILNEVNINLPHYRFQVMLQQANELCTDVKGLGNMLLSALEKKDGEEMALLRSNHELRMLEMIKDIKQKQRDESKENLNSIQASKAVVEEKYSFYNKNTTVYLNPSEKTYFDTSNRAIVIQEMLEMRNYLASMLAFTPEFKFGSGFTIGSTFGGTNLGRAEAFGINALQSTGALYKFQAESAKMKGEYDRRMDEWKFQSRSAELELKQIDKQIVAAEIRLAIAEKELDNHNLQMEQSHEVDDYLRSKFTNAELYDWMVGQLSAVYFQTYQLAYATAKKAEKSMQHELGLDSANYIQFGYWNSLKKGLSSGEKLQFDLRRLENTYLEENKREYEIVKHVSLAMLDPLALIKLRATGQCEFTIPEVLYDMDHPGHYFRRLKSVSISLPCVAGPYTSVSANLKLTSSSCRIKKEISDDGLKQFGKGQSIATSNAQNDSGVFELNFRDERYLPFEGCGAISSWELELPSTVRQFDYLTIADVIVHVKYTAREADKAFKDLVNTELTQRLNEISQQLGETGLHLVVDLKHDLSSDWNLLKRNGTIDIILDKSRLPYLAQSFDTAVIENVMFVAKVKGDPATFKLEVDGVATNLIRVSELKLCTGINSGIDLNRLFTLSVSSADKLEELLLVVNYKF